MSDSPRIVHMEEHKEFRCPKCGSKYWGTTMFPGDIERGFCHGSLGCHFSWPRSEDHKYFKPVTDPENYRGPEPEK